MDRSNDTNVSLLLNSDMQYHNDSTESLLCNLNSKNCNYVQDWTEVRSKVWTNPYQEVVDKTLDRVFGKVWIQCMEETCSITYSEIWPQIVLIIWNELDE